MIERPSHIPHSQSSYIAGGLCAVILVGVSLFLWNAAPHEAAYYRGALELASSTQDVVLRGVAYRVQNGVVYRDGAVVEGDAATGPLLLAYEKIAAERHPLIALPGTDLDRFDRAIEETRTTSALLSALQQDKPSRDAVAHSLYPLDFLEQAATLERARRAFLFSGSDADARVYRHTSLATVQAYRTDLDQFERAFTKIIPQTAPQYVMVDRFSDFKTVVSIIAELRNGMTATSAELSRRARCFSGKPDACASEDFALGAIPEISEQGTFPLGALSDAYSRLARPPFKEKLLGTTRSEEPFIELASPGCLTTPDTRQLFLVHSASFGSDTSYKNPIMPADRLVDATTQKDVPFFTYFLDRGVRYITSAPFVYYECTAYTHDAATLLGIDAVRAYARTRPLSTAQPTHTIRTLEQDLFSVRQPVTQSDAWHYAADVQRAASSGALDPEQTQFAIDLSLAIVYGSAGYENQLFNIAAIEQTNARLYRAGVPIGLTARDLFYTRNALSTFYMSFNPSVSGPHENLYPPASVPANQPYIFYPSLSASEKLRADRDQRYYFLVHHDPRTVPDHPSTI